MSVRVGVSAVVIRDGKILLGRRCAAQGVGTWSIPGGRMELGESPAQAAMRELREESGLLPVRAEPICWTDEIYADGEHWVTLHHMVVATGEPRTTEPDKFVEVGWYSEIPIPRFAAIENLLKSGWGF